METGTGDFDIFNILDELVIHPLIETIIDFLPFVSFRQFNGMMEDETPPVGITVYNNNVDVWVSHSGSLTCNVHDWRRDCCIPNGIWQFDPKLFNYPSCYSYNTTFEFRSVCLRYHTIGSKGTIPVLKWQPC